MMEWFYQIPGVDELRSAESFFQFFSVPYQPELLGRCSLPVLATFHRKLRAEVPLQNQLGGKTPALTGCWRDDCSRRAISNSFRRAEHETEIHL
ncbi:nitrogenase-stabilizing/protective protein nifW [Klebsiella michiganensis]|nr:nitrogenase-stabilizing/protective protein nifW [Klebsiella michiganensis]